MPATLLRASSATVLCHPIPGATPNSAIPGLEKATRNQLVEALVAEGKARGVAAALTSTTAKMLAEGRRLGVL